MKTIYTKLLFIVILFLTYSSSLIFAFPSDTIKSIPFTENWGSGSFSTNNWTFPDGQSNWFLATTSGLPAPCARFMGIPWLTNYSFSLLSPWFDATQLTCDYVYLDFDLRVDKIQETGNEKFRAEVDLPSSSEMLLATNNSYEFNCEAGYWHHYHINLAKAIKTLFRLRFIAYGENSANISGWYIDNIMVTSKQKPPRNFSIGENGQCGVSSCTALLTWSPPKCGVNAQTIEFIYDDGHAEEGAAGWSGSDCSFGNKFELSPGNTGFLVSFSAWFFKNPNQTGDDMLTVDVYDSTRVLIGSSEWFKPDTGWITVQASNIPFEGTFYAMIRWENIQGITNWLGYDINGPYSSNYWDYWLMGSSWTTPANLSGCEDGIFLLRATAIVPAKKKQSMEPDSTVILGYNIYKADGYENDNFIRINNSPVPDTTYSDYIDCMARYYVTTVFTSGESDPSAKLQAGCNAVGIHSAPDPVTVIIDPNPAFAKVEVSSNYIINEIKITDLFGKLLQTVGNLTDKKITLDVSGLTNGIYMVNLRTFKGVNVTKLIVLH
ncbi:MAG: T9SS type A sorting domain-containing protein [Bacteroidetes bacterium]|nr:T9SS type A sorting domain-containing protein [Bacteroidota bacterium]